MNSKEDRSFYTVLVIVIPFLVSGAWWITPWLGVPALFVGGIVWVSAFLMLGKEKQ